MSNPDQKATAFVYRLLSNAALNQLSPLQREEQILQFLQVNARRLYPTLSSQSFYPQKNWEQILRLLVEALAYQIDQELDALLNTLVKDRLDLSFVQFIRQQNMPQAKIKEQLLQFIQEALKKADVRREYLGPLNALSYRYTDRYLDQAFNRRQYVHFELVKVQRLRMGKEEIKHYVNLSLLLQPLIQLMTSSSGEGEVTGGIVQTQFMEKAVEVLANKMPTLPEPVVRSGVFANGSFVENRSLDATSRIAAILANMCRNARPDQKVDRGADTADKSWINIARRNYKFNGFDIKMLDEFYKIAAENGW